MVDPTKSPAWSQSRCPHRGCDEVFEIPEGQVGRAGRCPACGAPLTLRPLPVWDEMERRERAFRANDGAWIQRHERAPRPPGGERRRRQCFHAPDDADPAARDQALRQDLRYEAGRDLPAPRGARDEGLAVVLDDLRSQWNVGAIFRTAEALGWGRVHLVGITPMPPAPGLVRVALGAERQLPWDYHARALDLLDQLEGDGYEVWLLEQTDDAVPLAQLEAALPERLALVVGNEVGGVSPELLAACPRRVAIPLAGRKASLNAAVAFGIAAQQLAAGIASSAT